MKGQIRIENIRLVEKVEDDEEFERPNVFQVSSRVVYVAFVVVCKLVEVNRSCLNLQILYDSDSGKESYLLYIAATPVQQEKWITRLRISMNENFCTRGGVILTIDSLLTCICISFCHSVG